MYHLYKISNSCNDKIYLGVTNNPERRWKEHQYSCSNCTKLKRAFAKYGVENFKMEVLCIGTEEYILDLERKAIIAYNSISSGYNTIPGGNRAGVSLEKETKAKIAKGLDVYYAENVSANRGRTVAHRSDDMPVCAFGFWFPNTRTAIKALGINRKTLYARRKQGTLHLEVKPLKAVYRPKRNSEEDLIKRSMSMKGKNSGSGNGMFGRKNTSRSKPISIFGIAYPSVAEAVNQTEYTRSQIEKRLKKGDNNFFYIEV